MGAAESRNLPTVKGLSGNPVDVAIGAAAALFGGCRLIADRGQPQFEDIRLATAQRI
jgi:hypothetical protein